ncbi:MAG: extradiol dioxygenase [Pseudonocardiales bacterium]|nr:MAG: extradiol dioxygenase [Pseudonocardiales bacterium]
MAATITPVIMTADLERLHAFYRDLLAAEETMRVPDSGPTFYLGLRIGDSPLGLVADDGVEPDAKQRFLLSVEVADVDALLPRVRACGGHTLGAPNDMPWGQRVAHVQDPDGNSVNLTRQL